MSKLEGNILFGRRYRVIVGTGGIDGIEVSSLKCVFAIEKSMAETPNYSEITIYNLSAQTENTLIKSGQRIILEAGYEGEQYGLIFDGDIVQIFRDKEESVSYKLILLAQDGDLFLNKGVINTSLKAGQTPRTIVNSLSTNAENAIQLGSISDNLQNKELARGKICFGLAKDYLRQIAKSEQASFYVNDRQVNIVKAQDMPKGQALKLNAQTGLIGTLEQTETGIKGKCLLNPKLNLNSFLSIDNNSVRLQKISRDSKIRQLDQDGIYRIISLKHSGDTRGDSWYTEFTAISQVGEIPSTGKSLR